MQLKMLLYVARRNTQKLNCCRKLAAGSFRKRQFIAVVVTRLKQRQHKIMLFVTKRNDQKLD